MRSSRSAPPLLFRLGPPRGQLYLLRAGVFDPDAVDDRNGPRARFNRVGDREATVHVGARRCQRRHEKKRSEKNNNAVPSVFLTNRRPRKKQKSSPTRMASALIVVSGGPASGKSATAQAIASGLREAGMPVVVVSEDGPPSVAYADPPSEKQTRGSLRSAVDRALSSSKPPPAVVVDGCNSVKGFRYELWCLGRSARARYCCVCCPESGSSSDRCVDDEADSTSEPIGRWPRALFDDLAARVEPPDPRNRWEQPLFLADARRAKTEGGSVVRPAPASLPAGGRGSSIEETRGWPLDAVVAAVVAAVGPASKSGKKQEEEQAKAPDDDDHVQSEPEALPLATTSIALRPAKCTLTARVASADALGDLDAAAQAVLLAVAAAAKKSTNVVNSSSSSTAVASASDSNAFAAIEIPLPGSNEEGAEKGASTREPLTLSLHRAPTLAELRRHKRDFLRASTAPMAGPLPAGTRAGARAFCEYLKRRVV